MCTVENSTGPQYWAFISYSHRDADFGRKLHKWLEAYVLPRRLRGTNALRGPLPRRLTPIFRDRDEFAAASDLSAEVRAALERSRALIVVCSPAAAKSEWVGREVELFRMLHPDRPILAAIVEGAPTASFPDVLRRTTPSGEIEPLAADFRREGDGKRLALLKLVAGVAGLKLDTLVQRDTQRRLQRVTAVTVASVAVAITMGGLTIFALNAKAEAYRQRAEAEGLVEFMLTDLRTTLKGVGRLDAMTAVNTRALQYYGDQDLSRLPPDSLERRARILHALGEDDEARGDHRASLANFIEASRVTAALLALDARDPERVFNHAQSVFWIGYVAYTQGHYAEARSSFQAYSDLADRLLQLQPSNPRFLREKGFAAGNLCSLDLKPPKHPKAALAACKLALAIMERVAAGLPNNKELLLDLENRHAWLADACYANTDKFCERTHRLEQDRILRRLMHDAPKDMQLKTKWIACQRIIAWMEADNLDEEGAIARLKSAATISAQITAFDPSNKTWLVQREGIDRDAARITAKFAERTKK